MERIIKAIEEKLAQQETDISLLRYKVESLGKELKEKDEIIKNQSVIIDGLSMTVHEQRGEAR